MRRSIELLLLFLVLILMAGSLARASVTVTPGPTDPYVTSDHSSRISFYTNETSNTSAPWTSALKAYRGVTIHIHGVNVGYNLTVYGGTNETAQWVNGTTVSNHTAVVVSTNGTALWPVLTIGNQTFNFGLISVSSRPAAVDVPTPPITVSIAEYLKRETRTLLLAGLVMVVGLIFFYLFATAYKRGQVVQEL